MAAHSRADFENKLIKLAQKYPEFRKKLIENPSVTVAKYFNMEIPEELKVMIHEENEKTVHFVLPPQGGELNATEMASVSGGVCWSDCSCESDFACPPVT